MTFYDRLNDVINYLETHLELEIDYRQLAHRAGTNIDTLQRVFPLLTNTTIAEYLRCRRLTLAGRDLAQRSFRIADLAEKYGYTSPIAFSRAFTKFHGVKPSTVKYNAAKLRYYPKLTFTLQAPDADLEYEIITSGKMQLYGISVKTDMAHIKHDAPRLFIEAELHFKELGHPEYGMIAYNSTRYVDKNYEYWVLWSQSWQGLSPCSVSARRWLKFCIPSQEADDIQAMSDLFYQKFLPTCEYELTPEPELEHYHDGVTDFLIPIH